MATMASLARREQTTVRQSFPTTALTRSLFPPVAPQIWTRSAHTFASTALAQDTRSALKLIHAQPSHYVVASVVGRKYLLAPRDLLTVPRLKDVRVGDTLQLNEIHELGSRDYTLRGAPTLPKGAVNVQATVVEHTKGSMEVIVKKKRRKGYKKTIKHKQTYTRLRIGPFDFTDSQTDTPVPPPHSTQS